MLFVVDAFSFIKAVAVVVTKSPIVMHLWLSLSSVAVVVNKSNIAMKFSVWVSYQQLQL